MKSTIVKKKFIGRKNEIGLLRGLLNRKSSSLAVITGRRRIGKSRLIEEFAKDYNFLSFSGLAPSVGLDDQAQREEFAKQLSEQINLPRIVANDWSDLFTALAKAIPKRKTVVLLDEISWMGANDISFLPKLKVAWDLYFSKHSNLVIVLCGSISSWIEKNILSSTAFLGRVSLKINLEALSLIESCEMLTENGFKGSKLEKLIYLNAVGGVPWYLELFNSKLSTLENLRLLCFHKDGIFVDEFERIFNDLFSRRSTTYQKIVEALVKKPLDQESIAKAIKYTSGGPFSEYLNDLVLAGFITRDYIWNISEMKNTKLSKYRLSDNYLRFYIRFIKPNLLKIKKNKMQNIDLNSLTSWNTVMGLQFENLILNNFNLIYQELKLSPETIEFDGPYYQSAGSRQESCQIDYLIQTKYKTLFACEVKFSQKEINSSIIQEMKSKLNKLKVPRGFASVPVLIHCGNVNETVIDSEFFNSIIDINEMIL